MSALLSASAVNDALRPKLEQVRLVVGRRELAPLAAQDGAARVVELDTWRLTFGPGSIAAVRTAGESASWRVESKLGEPRVVADDDALALIVDGGGSSRVHPLDLEHGAWLPPLDGNGPVEGACVTSGHVLVLRATATSKSAFGEEEVGERTLTATKRGSTESAWTRSFPAPPPPERPGAVLLAPMRTAPVGSGCSPLHAFAGGLLLAADPAEPLRLLEPATGASRWELARVWEFQRGYVGPSVWQHFLARFGEFEEFTEWDLGPSKDTPGEATRKALDERRSAFERCSVGALLAGPFVLRSEQRTRWPHGGEDPRPIEERESALVVATVAPRDGWSQQLAQAFAYEIDGGGRPLSVVALPRAPIGARPLIRDDTVVLACTHGAFVALATSGADNNIGGMPGSGHDGVGRIAWCCEPRATATHPWLASDPGRDALALAPDLIVRVADGGRIATKDAGAFEFPLFLVDPRDGTWREAVLRVPFEGEVSLPTTNYSSDGTTAHVWGWRGLALAELDFDERALVAELSDGESSWRLRFERAELLR